MEGLQEIPLDEAWSLHEAGRALFLDARDARAFEMGHLPGALHIPPERAEDHVLELRALAQAGLALIAYCDGVDCPLSSELARSLHERGVSPVRVLVNGWRRWQEAGRPVERGRAP
jgi:rhodanese-related sulfurtransferase